jgi:hypothetical protein
MWDKVKSLGSKKKTNSLMKKCAIKGNETEGKTFQRAKNPKGVITLLSPTPASLVFCLLIAYCKIFPNYPKYFPFVNLKKCRNLTLG